MNQTTDSGSSALSSLSGLGWVQNDFSIVSWLYYTISSKILLIVQTQEDTTYKLWRAIHSLFRDNKTACYVYVDAEFRNID